MPHGALQDEATGFPVAPACHRSPVMNVLPDGVRHLPGYLDPAAQEALVAAIREVVASAPLFQPVMPRTGKPLSVRMTNCGPLGWVADKAGYRYQLHHPATGEPWPAMPETLTTLWNDLAGYTHPPEACLVNFYEAGAKMGLHQDRDEDDLDAPVVSVSLGDDALFRVGETTKGGPTRSIRLRSGDIVVLGGEGRLCYHGVDRIYPATSTLLNSRDPHTGSRLNLTLRRVTKPR